MIDRQIFIKGMIYLKAFYTNWDFVINNSDESKFVLDVWYANFDKLDTKTFQYIINKFTQNKKTPPNNPLHLLEWMPETNWMIEHEYETLGNFKPPAFDIGWRPNNYKQLENKNIKEVEHNER